MTSRTRETTRIDSPGFLDLDMPHQLFNVLERAFNRYRDAKAKKIDDALLLVLGLAMLREWIAPGYTGGAPRNPAERFRATRPSSIWRTTRTGASNGGCESAMPTDATPPAGAAMPSISSLDWQSCLLP